jgi:hypothetical protein
MASLVVDGAMAGIALAAAPIIFSLRLAGSPNLPNFPGIERLLAPLRSVPSPWNAEKRCAPTRTDDKRLRWSERVGCQNSITPLTSSSQERAAARAVNSETPAAYEVLHQPREATIRPCGAGNSVTSLTCDFG